MSSKSKQIEIFLTYLPNRNKSLCRSTTKSERENKMMSSGYTTLDNQKISGSVPAVSVPEQVSVKFSETVLQTFPPSEAQGKISSGYRPPRDADGMCVSSSTLSFIFFVAFLQRIECFWQKL
eukprot:TRINITY_DN701_c0_g1_i8.p1 TRINITY_DN701_c0_g1~~TRINITY_DN701_c0_g1_i8.p1  ORF type:complete len:129 (-),score=14.61 TRINITY_DN701_c0_g1_i8:291-656(-)